MRMQVGNNIESYRRCDHPVGTRFDGRAGVGIHDHCAIGMRIAKCSEFVSLATKIERASRIQIRHQDALFRAQYFRCFAHEFDPGHDQGLRGVITPETRHFQGIRHASAGFLGQILQIGVDIIMRDQYRLLFFQQMLDACFQREFFGWRRRSRHAHPGVRSATGTNIHLRAFKFDSLDGEIRHEFRSDRNIKANIERLQITIFCSFSMC